MNNILSASRLARFFITVAGAWAVAPASLSAATIESAVATGNLGLFGAADFRLATGRCTDCPAEKQAMWYFGDDTVAVPKAGAGGFSPRLRAQEDVREWQVRRSGREGAERPSPVWIGSPEKAAGWTLADDGASMLGRDGSARPFALVPKIEANRSYFDAASRSYFAGRPLILRGRTEGGRFVARTLWPEDFALDNPPAAPLGAGETLAGLVRAEDGGARAPLAARVLWQKDGGKPVALAGKPVLTFMLNGAQGDDDEAHGGHFAIATGRFGPHGEWGDWLVNNFYGLDSYSEKGIVASMLPMDAYMGDLNSGQSWYRPSHMLVAVLKDERAAREYQGAIARVFTHFYRHDFVYRHATANCAGISLETLRTLGWNIPKEGATNRLKAVVALPYMAIKEGSLESGKKAYDYLSAEVTDLYPFVAFDAIGRDLLGRVTRGGAHGGLEQWLAEDVEALVFVRIPQFPSSRAFGRAPVASFDEYMSRVPEDREKWQVVPVPPRPFPPEMKDAAAPADEWEPSSYAVAAYGGFFGLASVAVVRRRKAKAGKGKGGRK